MAGTFGGGRMRLDVYRGSVLAASFAFGRPAAYHGRLGQQVRALVEARHPVRNPWTGERAEGPRADTVEWWAATILDAGLGNAGFGIVATGVPLYPIAPAGLAGVEHAQ